MVRQKRDIEGKKSAEEKLSSVRRVHGMKTEVESDDVNFVVINGVIVGNVVGYSANVRTMENGFAKGASVTRRCASVLVYDVW